VGKPLRKVVVLGLDGLEPTLVEPMLAAGALPNLARLRDRGGFARVATTTPAQTPVAWSSFATGTNPGGHGIFDFLRRDPGACRVEMGLNRYEQKNAFTPPRPVNLRRGTPVWSILGEAGIPATVLRCPCNYPPDPGRARQLSGMGVPDLRGGFGTATFYCASRDIEPGEAERVVAVRPSADGVVASWLVGPRTPRERDDSGPEFTVRPEPSGERAWLHCAAAGPAELELPLGRWSEWLRVKFRLGLLQSVRGMVRFRLNRLGEDFALYASPVNFDPQAPPYPISVPADFAGELAGEIGPYYTAGMVEDHAGLSNGRLDESAFLDQCAIAWDEREAMMVRELARLDEGLFFCLFDTPDRVQHMFWRFREPDHPANRGRTAASEFAGVIEEHYRRADAAVGSALAMADDQTLVIVLSDHGFGSFRRCVDLNAWLHANGLLALREGLRPGREAGDLLGGIDWSRTKAYALGLGGIYLNLRGRESGGIVLADESEGLKAAIARSLGGLEDLEHGSVAVRSVRPREEVYRGPHVAEAPDLLVNFARGYRASWATSMGGIAGAVVEDNTNAWGGDHIVDPELVPGVLLMDRPFRGEGARLIDMAPTILAALGVPAGEAMEGGSLL
jgi:predicted AlkP superfamily phosphohydrolase/phosphomutase